jgi:hypothetical protein
LKQPICPECSTEYVTRVRREAIAERLVSLFYVYPFRCQLCGYRFSSVQWGVRYFRVDHDHREYERVPVNFPVAFVSGEVAGKGWVSDISMGGCTIRSETQLSYAQIVKVSLQIPGDDLPVTVDPAVVRNMQLNRIGLEFLRLQQVERKRLQLFIRSELQRRALRREPMEEVPTVAT